MFIIDYEKEDPIYHGRKDIVVGIIGKPAGKGFIFRVHKCLAAGTGNRID